MDGQPLIEVSTNLSYVHLMDYTTGFNEIIDVVEPKSQQKIINDIERIIPRY